jgi:hypothetical protein
MLTQKSGELSLSMAAATGWNKGLPNAGSNAIRGYWKVAPQYPSRRSGMPLAQETTCGTWTGKVLLSPALECGACSPGSTDVRSVICRVHAIGHYLTPLHGSLGGTPVPVPRKGNQDQALSNSAVRLSGAINIHHGLSEGLRRLLRQVVADTAGDQSMLIPA